MTYLDTFCLYLGRIVCCYWLAIVACQNYDRLSLWWYWRKGRKRKE